MKKAYCPMTHNSIHFTPDGKVTHCCIQDTNTNIWPKIKDVDFENLNEWYNNNTVLKEIRSALHNGIQHPVCKVCWEKEETGTDSKRYQHINEQTKKYKKDETIISFVDYRLSNKCNLQCKMCWPGASDQLENLSQELESKNIKHLFNVDKEFSRLDVGDKVTKYLENYENLEQALFAGGEPFIMPEVEELLIKLAEKNMTHVKIKILSNCTTIKTSVVEALEKFEDVEIMCSIDGVGEEIEYQRYPCSWKTIDKNFQKLYNSKIKNVNLTPCISFLNFKTIPQYFLWAEQFPSASIAFNVIHTPAYLNYRFVPMLERIDTIKQFSKYKFKNNVNSGWYWFQKRGMYEYQAPDQKICNQLYIQSQNVWDYKCKVKFVDAYPWATYMLDQAKPN